MKPGSFSDVVRLLDRVQKKCRSRTLNFDHIRDIITKVENGAVYAAIDGGTINNELLNTKWTQGDKQLEAPSYKTTLAVACCNYDKQIVVGIQRCEVMITENAYIPFYFPTLNRGMWKRVTEGPYLDINRFANAACSNKIVLTNKGW